MRDTEIDQPRFFAAGDNLDRKAQCSAGAAYELTAVFGDAKRIGADGAHTVRIKAAKTFAEAGETGQCAFLRFVVEFFVLSETCAQAYRFAQRVEREELFAGNPRDLAMEGIGTEIDGGNSGLFCHSEGSLPNGCPSCNHCCPDSQCANQCTTRPCQPRASRSSVSTLVWRTSLPLTR